MTFHGVDMTKQMKHLRERAPDAFRACLDSDGKVCAAGALPVKTKELMALAVAHVTQCPWCIDAHAQRAVKAGASDAEIGETIFVSMAMAAGAAWSHGGLTLQCLDAHRSVAR